MKTRSIRPLTRLAAVLLVPVLAACAGGSGGEVPVSETPTPEAGPSEALATITAEDVARAVGVLAHDSMAGRDTPSPELEAAARYLADRFSSMGLQPAGDSGTYFHRFEYNVSGLDPDSTTVRFEGGADPSIEWGTDYFLVPGMQPTSAQPVYVGVAGRDAPNADQRGTVVVMDHPGEELDQAWQQTLMSALQPTMMSGAAGMIMIMDSTLPAEAIGQIAGMAAGQQAPFPVVGISSEAAQRLFGSGGADLAEARAADGATSLGDGPVQVRSARTAETHTPPNVVAMREGSDPELRDTYVVMTAHFDHVGVGAPDESGDSIYNGADDDASGTAAVLEMAEAFATLPEAPARSVIFLAVSGEEKGLLGSMAYAEDPPMIEIGQIVANVNMDMIGRNAPDTVAGIGQEYTTLQGALDTIQAHHPDLGLNVVLDQWPDENLFFRSDQLAFVQQGVPAVFFTTGLHDDYHRPSDEPASLDADKAARVARLGFLLAYHIAQDPVAPKWTEEGRQAVEAMLQQSPF